MLPTKGERPGRVRLVQIKRHCGYILPIDLAQQYHYRAIELPCGSSSGKLPQLCI